MLDMTSLVAWPVAATLESAQLILEPLRVEHAEEMAPLLNDTALHTFTGSEPATLHQLRQIYALQVTGRSPDGTERWCSWILRRRDTLESAGYVQATVTLEEGVKVAEVAWVVARAHQGRGLAHEAASAMVTWLWSTGAGCIIAHVHPRHVVSSAVAAAVGLQRSDIVRDGEVRWSSGPAA